MRSDSNTMLFPTQEFNNTIDADGQRSQKPSSRPREQTDAGNAHASSAVSHRLSVLIFRPPADRCQNEYAPRDHGFRPAPQSPERRQSGRVATLALRKAGCRLPLPAPSGCKTWLAASRAHVPSPAVPYRSAISAGTGAFSSIMQAAGDAPLCVHQGCAPAQAVAQWRMVGVACVPFSAPHSTLCRWKNAGE